MCCGGLYSRCVHVAFGRLTTQQRLVFIAMIGLAFGFGAYYLNYVITKAQFASANPSTVLLSQSITTDSGIVAFPSFQLQVFAVYTGPQSCAATGEVWIQTGYPLNNTLGPAQRLNESRWSTDIIAQQLYPTMFVVTIPSHAWSIVNPMGLSIRLTLSNWNEHVCGLQLGVTSVDDLAPSQWAYSSSTDLRSGRKTFVALQGSADERLNKSVITHVQARFTASEPTNNALGNDSSTSIYVMSFNEGTLFQLAWRKQTIDYGWQDAAAALLAVLNVAWAVITFVYPNAVYAPHQRIYFRDIPSAHVNGTDPDRQLFVDKLIVTVQTGATTTAAGTSGGDTDAAVPTNPMLHSSA